MKSRRWIRPQPAGALRRTRAIGPRRGKCLSACRHCPPVAGGGVGGETPLGPSGWAKFFLGGKGRGGSAPRAAGRVGRHRLAGGPRAGGAPAILGAAFAASSGGSSHDGSPESLGN